MRKKQRKTRRGKKHSTRGQTQHPPMGENPVINLSNKVLTTHQLSALSKGLNFVPTCTVDPFEIKMDLFHFFRKIKLKHMFGGTETQGLNSSIFKKRSQFNPICSNPSIQTFCRIVERNSGEL